MRRGITLFFLFLASRGFAQTNEFVGGRLAAPPSLDGKIDEAEYRDAVHFSGLVDGQTGAVGAEGGDFYLGYDSKFVYFAARLVDLNPRSIQATEFRTNVGLDGNDTVTLALDPFNTLADFNRFTMNPRGATNLEIAGGRAAKREWMGDFASRGRVTETGWEVEARIPWSVMRLPGRGVHDLRFNVYRNHRRLQREFSWALTANGQVNNYGRWKTVDMPAPAPPRLLALPYLYGGADGRKGTIANAGIDLRYALSQDLDFVGTINPDFRNVERSILSLDFSYFERLADETRPFFLEGRQFFESWGDSPIFVTQRIGSFDGGGKVFGKLDPKTDIGVLATADLGQTDAVVARINQQTGPRSGWSAQYAGGGAEGRRNNALAAILRQGWKYWNFTGQLSGADDGEGNKGHRAVVNGYYERQRSNLFWRYAEVSPEFHPQLGYAPQTDYRGFDLFTEQGWAAPKKGFVSYGVDFGGSYYKSFDLKSTYDESASLYPGFTLRDGFHLNGVFEWRRFMEGADDQTYGLSLERPVGDPYRHWALNFFTGRRGGFRYENLSTGLSYRPLPTLQLAGTFQRTTYFGDTFDQTIVSANYDMDPFRSVGGRAVVSPGGTNWYLSFRQSGNRGAEYYLILGDPNAVSFRTSLILKAVFPFSLKV
jgi:hypothetical protein